MTRDAHGTGTDRGEATAARICTCGPGASAPDSAHDPSCSYRLAATPSRLELRGGVGPEQPVWDDCEAYSPEWYRRFRDWHRAEFPDSDEGTRDNLDMLARHAEGVK